MRCPRCGTEALPHATHCTRCGQPLIPPVAPPPFPYQPQPEQPEDWPAPHGARIAALLADGLFSFLLAIPGFVLIFAVVLSLFSSFEEGQEGAPESLVVLFGLYFLAVLPSVLYLFCRDGLKGGASWGKRLCGLKVVHLETGLPCTFGRSFLRYMLQLVNLWGIITLIEVVMVLTREDRRRLGDLIAGTMVVEASYSARATWDGYSWQVPPYRPGRWSQGGAPPAAQGPIEPPPPQL
jgi:uncharacterized RDD family membrane protein YckC